jgi:hypothetical protein
MKAIQKIRGLILVGMLLSGSQAFAQTTTNDQKQPVSSDQVLTRTPKNTKTSDLPATSGCTELTRVRPAVKRNTVNAPKQDVPVTIDRIKRD